MKTVHYDEWRGGTESDCEPPTELMCGTIASDPRLTQNMRLVTCKRCRKIIDRFQSDR